MEHKAMFHFNGPMRGIVMWGVACGAGSLVASEPTPRSSETNFYLQHTQPLIDAVLANLRDPSDQRWQTLVPSKEAYLREAERKMKSGLYSGVVIRHIRRTIVADGGAAVAARAHNYAKRSLDFCRVFLKTQDTDILATTTARVIEYGVERKPPPADRRRVYRLRPPHEVEITFGPTTLFFKLYFGIFDEKPLFWGVVPMGIVEVGERDLTVRLLEASPCYSDWQDRPQKLGQFPGTSRLLATLYASDITADGGTRQPVFILSYVLDRKGKIPEPGRIFYLLSDSYPPPPPEPFLKLANRSLDTGEIVDVPRTSDLFAHAVGSFRVDMEQLDSTLKKEGREISPEWMERIRRRNNLSLEKFTISKYGPASP